MDRPAPDGTESPWPRRLAWATLLAALPLLAFGGMVTTLRAGLAIDGWWVLEPGRGDHFLLLYPIDQWLRDEGTFSEHTHRLLGTLVGSFALAGAVVSVIARRRGRARRAVVWLSIAALFAISFQGLIGGLRVLEKSGELAFLHGALAQAVFALLAAQVVVASPAWRAARASPRSAARGLHGATLTAAAAVYAQIVIGAWLRHTGSGLALVLHVLLVAVVLVCVLVAARWLRIAAEDGRAAGTGESSLLERVRRRLVALLAAQIALGLLATAAVFLFSGGFQGEVSAAEMVFATLHVLFGALLLAQSLAAALWARRLVLPGRTEPAGSPALGGAR